jgi:hypothetical protein
MEGGFCPESIKSLPKIGEGMGEWLKPLLGKRGWGVVKNLLVLFEKDKKK